MLIESLRDYQIKALDELRDGVRKGHRSQILVAPTGAGKTVSASYLLNEARAKQNVAWFICDRVSLVDQTSATLDRYGVPHGVIRTPPPVIRLYDTMGYTVSIQCCAGLVYQ